MANSYEPFSGLMFLRYPPGRLVLASPVPSACSCFALRATFVPRPAKMPARPVVIKRTRGQAGSRVIVETGTRAFREPPKRLFTRGYGIRDTHTPPSGRSIQQLRVTPRVWSRWSPSW